MQYPSGRFCRPHNSGGYAVVQEAARRYAPYPVIISSGTNFMGSMAAPKKNQIVGLDKESSRAVLDMCMRELRTMLLPLKWVR